MCCFLNVLFICLFNVLFIISVLFLFFDILNIIKHTNFMSHLEYKVFIIRF